MREAGRAEVHRADLLVSYLVRVRQAPGEAGPAGEREASGTEGALGCPLSELPSGSRPAGVRDRS